MAAILRHTLIKTGVLRGMKGWETTLYLASKKGHFARFQMLKQVKVTVGLLMVASSDIARRWLRP
jgi:hypothetical protein